MKLAKYGEISQEEFKEGVLRLDEYFALLEKHEGIYLLISEEADAMFREAIESIKNEENITNTP